MDEHTAGHRSAYQTHLLVHLSRLHHRRYQSKAPGLARMSGFEKADCPEPNHLSAIRGGAVTMVL